MSHRLQVLITEDLNRRLDKAARQARVAKGEWVRRALRDSLQRRQPSSPGKPVDPLDRLFSLNAPTADIRQMIREIESGRD